MGGPWFTVQELGDDGRAEWEELSSVLLSDGTKHTRARVEVRVELPGSARSGPTR